MIASKLQTDNELSVLDVIGTHDMRHRLEFCGRGFSLGVVLDNIRFVTANALKLMRFLNTVRQD